MDKLKIAMMALVAALLVVVILDRSRQTEQMADLKRAVDAMTIALQRGVVVAQGPTGTAPATAKPAAADDEKPEPPKPPQAPRDGNVKLGVNFLLPYDRSTHHADWQGGTLKQFNVDPKGLNPLTDNSTINTAIYGLVNDSLCERPATAPEQWQESLAESVVIDDDYRTYTFKLRAGVKWQRPPIAKQPQYAWLDRDVELTADDFVFTLRMIQDPAVDCPSTRNYYEDLDKAEAPDARTLIVRWKKKVYTSLAATMGLQPLPRHIYGRNADGSEIAAGNLGVVFNKHWFDQTRNVAGVGAYQMTDYQQQQRMVFRRNQDYWGAPLHFDGIEWNLQVRQDDPQLIAFKNGQVHYHGLSPLKYKSEILDHGEERFAPLDPANPKAGRAGQLGWERVKGMSFTYLGWNMRRWPFDDQKVRQAMSHAFPKDRIIKDVFFGLGLPVLSDVLLDSQYCNHDLKPYAFDLARAKALLSEAGWSDSDGDGLLDKEIDGKRQAFAFDIKYYANSPEWDNTLAIFRNELRKIGVDMTPLSMEFSELMRVYEDKDFQGVVGGWQMDWDIDYKQLWYSTEADQQGSSNHCGFKNTRVDELADKLRVTFETPERVAIVKEIQAIIHDQQPYTFFKSGEGIFVWQNHPGDGQANDPERWLAGVIKGLDTFHPLVNRTRTFWHFRR